MNCGDTVAVTPGEIAEETVGDSGGLPVYTIFWLEKNSSFGFVTNLALGDAGIREDYVLGPFDDGIQVPDLSFRRLDSWDVCDLHVRLEEQSGIGAALDYGGALVVERVQILTSNTSFLDGGFIDCSLLEVG